MSTEATPATADEVHIQIDSFSLPRELSGYKALKSLHITSDIPLDVYHATLKQTFLVPKLPESITSLTLELFTFGYPLFFLSSIAENCPNLRSVTFYSQLLAGTTAESFNDVIDFFRKATKLVEVHAIDVFLPNDFLGALGALKKPFKALEFSWAFREEDPQFNKSLEVPIKGIAELLQPGLVSLTVSITVPEGKIGMTPCTSATGKSIIAALESWPSEAHKELRAIDFSAFEIETKTWKRFVKSYTEIEVCRLSVVHDGDPKRKTDAMDALRSMKKLKIFESTVVSGIRYYSALRQSPEDIMESTLLRKDELLEMTKDMPLFESFDLSILKVPQLGFARWKKVDGVWTGVCQRGPELSESEKKRVDELEKS